MKRREFVANTAAGVAISSVIGFLAGKLLPQEPPGASMDAVEIVTIMLPPGYRYTPGYFDMLPEGTLFAADIIDIADLKDRKAMRAHGEVAYLAIHRGVDKTVDGV